jgi:hypothetical protein
MNSTRTVSAFSLQPSAFPAQVQPVSKEALIGAIKKCHQTLWAGTSSRGWRLYESDSMNPFPNNRKVRRNIYVFSFAWVKGLVAAISQPVN